MAGAVLGAFDDAVECCVKCDLSVADWSVQQRVASSIAVHDRNWRKCWMPMLRARFFSSRLSTYPRSADSLAKRANGLQLTDYDPMTKHDIAICWAMFDPSKAALIFEFRH